MSAIRLARAVSSRQIIVKFEGLLPRPCGRVLVKAGSGRRGPLECPAQPGVQEEIAHLTLALPTTSRCGLKGLPAHSGAIAAVILEPVVASGCIAACSGYLAGLRAITRAKARY